MKIVSWNCNGALRKKFKTLLELNADIYVVQECENPNGTKDKYYKDYKKFASNYIWVGNENTKKGVGIFAKDTINLKNNNWKSYGLEWFISCDITFNDKTYNLIGLWGHQQYIAEIYVYLHMYYENLNKNTIICGDFNSNTNFDKKNRIRNHSAVVKILEEIDLYSCYHIFNKENQGKETTPTFYIYRNKEKRYHIDYFFVIKINSMTV